MGTDRKDPVIPVGYLRYQNGELRGEPGIFYNYIQAGNGIFIQAENNLIGASIKIANVNIRGLDPIEKENVLFKNGKLPLYIYLAALDSFKADSENEQYLAVQWNNGYKLIKPDQEVGAASIDYKTVPSTIMDIHSHASMPALFSSIDDRDEQGFRIYAIMGRIDTTLPTINMRIGVYGYFRTIHISEVFRV